MKWGQWSVFLVVSVLFITGGCQDEGSSCSSSGCSVGGSASDQDTVGPVLTLQSHVGPELLVDGVFTLQGVVQDPKSTAASGTDKLHYAIGTVEYGTSGVEFISVPGAPGQAVEWSIEVRPPLARFVIDLHVSDKAGNYSEMLKLDVGTTKVYEIEPNDTAYAAYQNYSKFAQPCTNAYHASLLGDDAVDWYQFALPGAATWTIATEAWPGQDPVDLDLDVFSVHDQVTPVASASSPGFPSVDVTQGEGEQYFVRVTAQGTSRGSYRLVISAK